MSPSSQPTLEQHLAIGADDLSQARSRLANYVMVATAIYAVPAAAASVMRWLTLGFHWLFVVHLLMLVVLLGAAFNRHRLSLSTRGIFLSGWFAIIGIAGMLAFGTASGALFTIFLSCACGYYFYGDRLGTAWMVGLLTAVAGTGLSNLLIGPLSSIEIARLNADPLHWLVVLIAMAYFCLVVVRAFFSPLREHLAQAYHQIKRSHDALALSEERYRSFVDNCNEGIWCVEFSPPVDCGMDRGTIFAALAEGRLSHCNAAFRRLLKLENDQDPIGRRVDQVFTGGFDSILAAYQAAGLKRYATEIVEEQPGLATRVLHHSLVGTIEDGYLIRTWGIIEDHSALRHTEAELQHSRQLDAIGQLTGGIAHDFNNMLAGVLGAAELLEEDDGDHESRREMLSIIVASAERARDLNSKLLAYSRKGKLQSTPSDLNTLARDACSLLQHSIDPRIRLHMELAAEPALVIGDPSQLQSAILNLGINARDAITAPGTITVVTRNVELSAEDCQDQAFSAEPGRFVEVAVSDDGSGIAEEVRSRIFEPYFTTKPTGKGTGLGLAAIFGTVVSHHGLVRLESTPGHGSTFRLCFPQAAENAVHRESTRTMVRGAGTILVVDDQELVRRAACLILESCGYRVLEANDGVAALATVDRNPAAIDAVLLDLAMPEMDGHTCFTELRRRRPDLPVVLASGFIVPETVRELKAAGISAVLPKPYHAAELTATFARVLGPGKIAVDLADR